MAIFGMPGGAEWWIILVVILLLFGPTQLPKLAKMIGKSAKTLKEGIDGKLGDDEEEPKPKTDAKADAAVPKKDDTGDEA
ncbi:MAG: twin-arginine translocase TatA/TatE family subunit [Coriobacteriia bacterium]|nr:twin-arginine translocase TatA/TatE family subunit [Coriobacteriia bacterium]